MFDNSLEAYLPLSPGLDDVKPVTEGLDTDLSSPHQLLSWIEPPAVTSHAPYEVYGSPIPHQSPQILDGFLEVAPTDLELGDALFPAVNEDLEADSLLAPGSIDNVWEMYKTLEQGITELAKNPLNISRLLELIFPRETVTQEGPEEIIQELPQEIGLPTPPIGDNPLVSFPDTLPPSVRKDLANHLGISPDQVTLQNYSRHTWSDGCLGLGGPAELCTMATVEGWQIEVVDSTTNESYVYRSNLHGDHIRREP